MQEISRINKSIRNTILGVGGLICNLIATFISKSFFIRLLGVAYNGINGLFSNILQVLNLAELGFAATIALSLYKPLKEEDNVATAQLMNYFAKVYRVLAIIVAVAGCCCIPFLQYLIAEDISELSFSLNELRGYFAMYLASTVCSYLLAYKRTIIIADQNSYIVTNIDNISNILLNILQIILLLIYKNYYIFLAIMIAKTLINNIVIQLYANKKYPYLKKYRKEKLPKSEKTIIIKNVRAMFIYKIGSVVVYSTSSIIISAFVSLTATGLYGNYLVVISNINAFVNIFVNSIVASIGNLCLSASQQYQYIVFKRIQYLTNFITVFSLCCFICLFNPFIDIWLGQGMTFSMATVIVISLNASMEYLRKAVLMFRDAIGLFRIDWYKPIIEAVISIVLAIGFSYCWQTFGVVFGYLLARALIAIPIETYTLFKHCLRRKVGGQMLEMTGVLIFAAMVTAVAYSVGTFIPGGTGWSGVGWFVLRFVFVVVFAAGVFILATCRTEEFKYYKGLAMAIIKKIVGKIKVKLGKKQPAEVFTAIDANEQSVEQNVGDENGSEEEVEQKKEDAESSDSEKVENAQSVDNDKQNDGGGDGE